MTYWPLILLLSLLFLSLSLSLTHTHTNTHTKRSLSVKNRQCFKTINFIVSYSICSFDLRQKASDFTSKMSLFCNSRKIEIWNMHSVVNQRQIWGLWWFLIHCWCWAACCRRVRTKSLFLLELVGCGEWYGHESFPFGTSQLCFKSTFPYLHISKCHFLKLQVSIVWRWLEKKR